MQIKEQIKENVYKAFRKDICAVLYSQYCDQELDSVERSCNLYLAVSKLK